MVLACGLMVVLWNLVFSGWTIPRTLASLKQQRQAVFEAAVAAAVASAHQLETGASMERASLDEQIAALAAPFKEALATASNSFHERATAVPGPTPRLDKLGGNGSLQSIPPELHEKMLKVIESSAPPMIQEFLRANAALLRNPAEQLQPPIPNTAVSGTVQPSSTAATSVAVEPAMVDVVNADEVAAANAKEEEENGEDFELG
eukprot:CAMPEP_0172808254 /NCGR_PEP_ID=MMETSP1075-20121228/7565_1 /TAXON_ID=2916 /ORGANISM="Ceratium fusus, Strain PA161109" /LENGTH=203 /DNA_ID=CAMNT_0013647379 /DNA_START=320 /DNA_END=927 /DNA_ORIENTATION=-